MPVKQISIMKFFSSMKLAICLLALIALVSLAGTFMPKNNIYSAWWFIALLGLLALNLVFCLIKRFSVKGKPLGTTISHISILVILAGALAGMVWGQKADIRISEGQVMDFKDFSLRLDDFIYEEDISPQEKLLVYSKYGKLLVEASAETGKQSDIAGTGYKLEVLRYVPDFVMDMNTKVVTSRSMEPKNPAIQIKLQGKDSSPHVSWVFAAFPDMHRDAQNIFTFKYQWRQRRPKDFISKVTVIKNGKEIMRKDIRVNSPLKYAGYAFFQLNYDTENLSWTGLQAVKDPGVPVVYSGFILLITGLVMRFYITPLIQREGKAK